MPRASIRSLSQFCLGQSSNIPQLYNLEHLCSIPNSGAATLINLPAFLPYGQPYSSPIIHEESTQEHLGTPPIALPLLQCPALKILPILAALNSDSIQLGHHALLRFQLRKLFLGRKQGQSWDSFHEFQDHRPVVQSLKELPHIFCPVSCFLMAERLVQNQLLHHSQKQKL